MTDRSALLANVIANPYDNTPRLVWADWLEEHGDEPLARLIRLQCDVAVRPNTGETPDDREQAIAALTKKHATAWLGKDVATSSLFRFGWEPDTFERGILASHSEDVNGLLQKNKKKFRERLTHIGVHRLRWFGGEFDRMNEVADQPMLTAVSEMQFEFYSAKVSAHKPLLSSPHLRQLAGWILESSHDLDPSVRQLAKSDVLPNLQKLVVGTDDFSAPNYQATSLLTVLNSGRFPRLNILDLNGKTPRSFDWEAFLADEGLRPITDLTLGWGCRLAALAANPHVVHLRKLTVNSGLVTDSDAKTLLNNSAFKALHTLELHGMNSRQPRLSGPVVKALKKRFDDGFTVSYAGDAQ